MITGSQLRAAVSAEGRAVGGSAAFGAYCGSLLPRLIAEAVIVGLLTRGLSAAEAVVIRSLRRLGSVGLLRSAVGLLRSGIGRARSVVIGRNTVEGRLIAVVAVLDFVDMLFVAQSDHREVYPDRDGDRQ